MHTLGIDIETYSDIPIRLGVYRYSQSASFDVLLFSYQLDDGPVTCVDLTKESLPPAILSMLQDKRVLKTAFNAQFERVCLDTYLGIKTGPWACTMILAWNVGFTGGLDAVSKALGIPEEKEKLKEGKRLIQLFCTPQGKNKEKTDEDWKTFIRYNKQDVEVESFIRKKLSWFTIEPKEERELYTLDQVINDRGVRIDLRMAENAVKITEDLNRKYTKRFQELTGIESPTKLIPFKAWLQKRTSEEIEGVTKGSQDELYAIFANDPAALEALQCRYKTGKTSTAKYQMMLDATCPDGRMRGTLQFYGAKTGRFSGRLLQVQNLPKNHVKDLATARYCVKETDLEFLELLYDDPGDILSQCIRPTLIPKEGHMFVVSDFSAIEARVIAWISGESWVLEVFRTTGKIYEAAAARMLHVPLDAIKKPSPERQKGKVATLALGYQGGVNALIQMGALSMGIPEDELGGIVKAWRKSNSHIVKFWYDIESAVRDVVRTRERRRVRGLIDIFYTRGILFIRLPSGRALSYPLMRERESKRYPGRSELIYGEPSSTGSWTWKSTYGGKLVENIVQGTARDILGISMLRLEAAGYPIVMHVHDEVVIEVKKEDTNALFDIKSIMGKSVPWAKDLPLNADAYTCPYYRKD